MTVVEIKELIESLGLPCTYYSYPEGKAPDLPYIVWYFPNSSNFSADDKVYANIEQLNIELYTMNKDFSTEKRIEGILDDENFYWDKLETYIDSEHMYQVLYQTEVFINEG